MRARLAHHDPRTVSALTREQARAEWRGARSFEDLCALGARFLAGDLSFFPGWGAPETDAETDSIAARLIEFHRAGFLTVASQPGGSCVRSWDGARESRRAFVTGFASSTAARAIATLGTHAELLVAVFAPGAGGGHAIPVVVCDGEPRAHCGIDAAGEELELFREHCSQDALASLSRAWYVAAIDGEWERDGVLWDAISTALRRGIATSGAP